MDKTSEDDLKAIEEEEEKKKKKCVCECKCGENFEGFVPQTN